MCIKNDKKERDKRHRERWWSNNDVKIVIGIVVEHARL